MTKQAIIKAMKGCTKGFTDSDKPLKLFQIKFEDSDNGNDIFLKVAVPADWYETYQLEQEQREESLSVKLGELPEELIEWNKQIQMLNHAIQEKKIAIYNIA